MSGVSTVRLKTGGGYEFLDGVDLGSLGVLLGYTDTCTGGVHIPIVEFSHATLHPTDFDIDIGGDSHKRFKDCLYFYSTEVEVLDD